MVKFNFTELEILSKELTLESIPIFHPDVVNSHPVKNVITIGSLGRSMLTVYKILLLDDETVGKKLKS
jgi:hypothetical protein